MDLSNSTHNSDESNENINRINIDEIEKNMSSSTTIFEKTHTEPNNGPWNYKILLLLRKIGKKTMGYRWMHEQESQYYEKVSGRINIIEMLILALLGTITGGGFINFAASSGLDGNKVVYIIITVAQLVIIFLSAIIKGYSRIKEYEKKFNNHTNASIKNAELNLSIQYQLSLNLPDRENDKIYLKNVINSFNDILLLSPNIRNVTKNKYLEESNDNDIFNPIIAEEDGPNIVINYDNNKTEKNVGNNNIDSHVNYQIDRWLQHF